LNVEDLAPFAACDGLRAHMLANPGRLTDDERLELLTRARASLATAFGLSLEDAGRAMHEAAKYGDIEVRSGSEFAAVFAYGRVVHCATRAELRGVCHPEFN
jgi:hypothetical protein